MLTLPVQHALARSELFAACDPQRVVCRVQFFAKNSRIAAGLEKEPAVGLIVRGKVLVYSWGLDGKAVGLSTLKLGESFGISNILTGEELTTMLISGGQTAIAYIPKRCFLELLEHTPGMMLRYATLCNQKLRYLTEKIAFLAIPSCRARLATWLLKNGARGVVTLEDSKEQLARILGVSRASLFRELRELSDAGFIEVNKRVIVLRNVNALRGMVENAS